MWQLNFIQISINSSPTSQKAHNMWDLSFSYWHLPTLIVEVAGSSRHHYLSAEVMQGSDMFLAELHNCVVRCIWHGLVTCRLILEYNRSVIPILKTFTLLQVCSITGYCCVPSPAHLNCQYDKGCRTHKTENKWTSLFIKPLERGWYTILESCSFI